ncbi:glycosyltransferase [Halorubrum vacuolatum]|uniref:Glycosyltransferase involved in cell wall bisynthesis n=1 Tax=Halorubrum vacuolatum TaxID=63740 RepID=A0A238XQ79_HALVU|nr:glycosyltransferase [Halorubrum vacuolatum]SNR60738.1 Glycosyltransferase involved in cell wall bisynthesis [Halorubrum vacuolatum]
MSSVLFLYLDTEWKTDTDSGTGTFDNTLYFDMLDADVGVPLTVENTPLQFAKGDKFSDGLEDEFYGAYPQVSSMYHEAFCVSDEAEFSFDAKLFDGEIVDIRDYDVLVISHHFFYNFYIKHLLETCPELSIIGIMEGGFQDVTMYSPKLQLCHREVLRSVDGYIVSNRQYKQYAETFNDNVIFLPFHVPEGHFQDVSPRTSSEDKVCLGITSWNIDHSNFYTSILLLDALRDAGFGLEGEIIGVKDHHQRMVADYNTLEHVSTVGFIEEGYYEYLSSFDLAIQLTNRATAGRVSAEFAGVGVPVIGNKYDYLQQRCWPELSIEPYDIRRATKLAKELLTNDDFYRESVAKARDEISSLQEYDETAAKLESFLASTVAADS